MFREVMTSVGAVISYKIRGLKCTNAYSVAEEADFAMRMVGNGMEGTLQDADIVFFQTACDVEDGQIAAVVLDGEAALKRVYHTEAGILLRSDNPAYAPEKRATAADSGCRIIGRAVGYFRRMN